MSQRRSSFSGGSFDQERHVPGTDMSQRGSLSFSGGSYDQERHVPGTEMSRRGSLSSFSQVLTGAVTRRGTGDGTGRV